jgi:hypothetical protein
MFPDWKRPGGIYFMDVCGRIFRATGTGFADEAGKAMKAMSPGAVTQSKQIRTLHLIGPTAKA